MKKRRVEKIEEEISVIGFGCWGFSGPDFWTESSDSDSTDVTRAALDIGINLFDVAPVYGFGHAEEVLGKALKGKRSEALIATKCGLIWDSRHRTKNCLKPESIFNEIDQSLQRLGTDYVDLYQIHWPDHDTPIEDTIDALLKIKKMGKIRYIGVSNFPVTLTKKAMEYTDIVSQQCLYNMLERNEDSYHGIALEYKTEKEVIPFCEENGQAFFPYSPLMQGLLTDAGYRGVKFSQSDVRASNPQLNGERLTKNLDVIFKLKGIADEIDKPLSQLAINWLLLNEGITSVISGALNGESLLENARSIEWEIDGDTLEKVNKILYS